jgi:hypothetical protein
VGALCLGGPGVTFIAEGGVGRIVGVVCLIGAVTAGAAYALAPERLKQEAD